MKLGFLKATILLSVLFLLSGCADKVHFENTENIELVGFWHGLWHGYIIIFSWIGSLLYDDIAIYAVYNNGFSYNTGFMIGAVGFGSTSELFKLKDSSQTE